MSLGAFDNQDLPFEFLVDELKVERDLSRSPVFQVMFDMQHAVQCPDLPGLRMSRIDIERHTSHFDMALIVRENADASLEAQINYNTDLFEASTIKRMLGHYNKLLESIAANPGAPVSELELIPESELRLQLEDWNATTVDSEPSCMHTQFEAQVARTPDAEALVFKEERLTYGELNARANRLAHHLRGLGVGPDDLVGVCMDRSVEMMVSLLATHKAGGAYVPLDPTYPSQRIEFMLEDSSVKVLLTKSDIEYPSLSGGPAVVHVDELDVGGESAANPESGAVSENLAYVIYTSGSTGKPKGVMVEHRNVSNFFVGMDDRVGAEGGGRWLAVTSISFDISVLELFWTLTRGFTVVLQPDENRSAAGTVSKHADKGLAFSLFYFAADESKSSVENLQLLMEGAKYADANGYEAVWTPERHFHSFGGLYPNPAVTSAAIAAITENVRIRAGSVVLPLHDPIRVAEEWSWVDNLSKGRVGVAFASGWHDQDFVFQPDNFADRRQVMKDSIDTVQHLWKGGEITRKAGSGKEVTVSTLPRPVQPRLPYWLTASGNPATFEAAGKAGANILTHLLGQSVEDMQEKVAIYRRAWEEAGHEGRGQVTIMLHTFIGDDIEAVREIVREPFTAYLRTAVDLIGKLAEERGQDIRAAEFSDEDMDALMEHAFNRYFKTSALFGTPESCVEMVDRLKDSDVDEVACLIDFGVDPGEVINSLDALTDLKQRANPTPVSDTGEDYSVGANIRREKVTHFQCTPSQAGMLVEQDDQRDALTQLKLLMLGGEAFPASLAQSLLEFAPDIKIENMYGPTETTIWSSTHTVNDSGLPPIGTPIANTDLYVLDTRGRPVPIGVPGELFIGGAGVVRGYYERSRLTRERFVRNPFGSKHGDRMYRTGDLVRYRADGVVEYLGRLDHQLKIHGHRIELGEIESQMASVSGVAEAVAVAREDTPGDVRLIGYYRADESVKAADIKDHLRSILPEYMIPSLLMEMEKFPLTPNGKVDRKALPAPDMSAARDAAVEFVEPEGDLEVKIADVWKSVLKVSEVGVGDNFFDVGGNSIVAVRVHNALKKELGLQLVLTDMFRFPTIRTMARHLESQADGDSASAAEMEKTLDRAAARRQALKRRRRTRS